MGLLRVVWRTVVLVTFLPKWGVGIRVGFSKIPVMVDRDCFAFDGCHFCLASTKAKGELGTWFSAT